MSSSRGKNNSNIGRRIAANRVHANAFIPCVSEKISTQSPNKKDIVINQFTVTVMGMRMMIYINTNGVATLNKHI